MKEDNKSIHDYMRENRLEIGGFLYAYMLGELVKYKLVKIVESEYNDEKYACLRPIASLHFDRKKWEMLKGYGDEKSLLRANIRYDTRFNINEFSCLKSAIASLQAHIESSQWQMEKAKTILTNIKC